MTKKINYTFMVLRISIQQFWDSSRFGKFLKGVGRFFKNRIIFPFLIIFFGGLSIAFWTNFSNSPEFELLIRDRDIVSIGGEEYQSSVLLINRGGSVDFARVQIFFPRKYNDYVELRHKWVRKSVEKDEVRYQIDIKGKLSFNAPIRSSLLKINLNFSKYDKLKFNYRVSAESMADRVGRCIYERKDGEKPYIVKENERKISPIGYLNIKGKILSWITGKHIR